MKTKHLLTLIVIMGLSLTTLAFSFMGLTETEQRLQTISQNVEIQKELSKENDIIRRGISALTGEILRLEMDLNLSYQELGVLITKRDVNSAEWNIRKEIINQNNARIDEITNFPMDQ